ncbi:hypothetical protein OAA41_00725 [bacterium]|jgi:hypothetical protein|nr:hypothetical protein [bacterium]|tara:strand:+ start:3612 stop:3830 length:219 start_codon:yes stop_codon:yes gene_type:complete
MIGYAPIDFDDPLEIPTNFRKREVVDENFEKVPEKKVVKAQPVIDETTECNYVVMFFIVGVLALAAMDSVKK